MSVGADEQENSVIDNDDGNVLQHDSGDNRVHVQAVPV